MMDANTLVAEKRDVTGRRACARLRSDGKIPAVLYGRGGEAISLTVTKDDIMSVLHSEDSHLLKLNVGEEKEDVLIKDLQYDHLGDSLLHLDFERVSLDEEIVVSVAVEIRGESPGIEQEKGILQFSLKEIEIICLPTRIPSSIVVDISELHIDQAIHIRELKLPEGVRTEVDSEVVVAQVVRPQEEGEAGEVDLSSEPELIRPAERSEEK